MCGRICTLKCPPCGGLIIDGAGKMYLSEACVGKNYTVIKLDLPFETERRLEALGMTDRAPVSVINRKGKGILIIKLRGTRFALGYNITKNITVEEAEKTNETV